MSDVKELNGVIYVDGSCKPNPSICWGSGWHGYLYTVESIGNKNGDRPTKYAISDIGYVEAALAAKSDYQTVIPTHYINGTYQPHNIMGSNNTGEAMAVIKVIDELLKMDLVDMKLTKVTLKSDSMYVLNIIKAIRKNDNWKDSVTTNREYWDMLSVSLGDAVNAGLDVVMVKVAGHSTSLGNHLADRMALMGRINSVKLSKPELLFKVTPAVKYWKVHEERHPFLQYKQLFFINGVNPSKHTTYTILDYKKDVEPGKKSHEAAFGLVRLTEAVPSIENIKNVYNNLLSPLSLISTIDLSVLYSQNTERLSGIFGNDIYTFSGRGRKHLTVLEEDIICSEVYPPGLAKKAFEEVVMMERHLDEYVSGTNTVTNYTDITDTFFHLNEKEKLTISIDNITKYVTVKHLTKFGDEVTVPLQFGKDLISRNQLKKLEKLEPVVTLVTNEISNRYIQYYIIIETKKNKDLSIWCQMFSNNIVLGKNK